MTETTRSRRSFLKISTLAAGAALLPRTAYPQDAARPDYTVHIQTNPIEIAPNHIVSATTYNGKFPGPLLRFKEGQPVTIAIFNDTDTP